MSKFVLICVSFFAICTTNIAIVHGAEYEYVDFAANLQAALEPTSSLTQPGFILQVVREDQVLATITSGAADIEQVRAITEETVFHIASLSKQITAAGIALGIADGKLSLDDPVAKWVAGTAKYGNDLTIAHLVYMTSGLTEYYETPRKSGAPWATFHYFDIDEAIAASLSVDELQFQPGANWQYSNINYMLLTKIVEAAYDAPFREVIAKRIFEPLEMDSSLINDDVTEIIENRANAYTKRTPQIVENLRYGARIDTESGEGLVLIRRNAPHYGGSGVMTSMRDWARWNSEMHTHAVLGDDFWSQMMATQRFEHDKSNDAFGLVHSMYENEPMVWYEGGDIDASSYSVVFPGLGLSVACFSNDPYGRCSDKVSTVLRLLWGK